jgi:hypothetical protein
MELIGYVEKNIIVLAGVVTLLPEGECILANPPPSQEIAMSTESATELRKVTVKVIPRRVWENSVTGKTASIFGASPYTSEAGKLEWKVVTKGWTKEYNRNGSITTNNVGGTGKPFPEGMTYEECVADTKLICEELGYTYIE